MINKRTLKPNPSFNLKILFIKLKKGKSDWYIQGKKWLILFQRNSLEFLREINRNPFSVKLIKPHPIPRDLPELVYYAQVYRLYYDNDPISILLTYKKKGSTFKTYSLEIIIQSISFISSQRKAPPKLTA